VAHTRRSRNRVGVCAIRQSDTLPAAYLGRSGGAWAPAVKPIKQIAGTLSVQPQMPGGSFAVEDRVFHWDVLASGSQPVPSWGAMRIANGEGAWEGTFTGIKSADGAPVVIRAFLVGEGIHDGLCATLDISATGTATGDTWMVEGVIHPDPMQS
jgi:hypothetical protein